MVRLVKAPIGIRRSSGPGTRPARIPGLHPQAGHRPVLHGLRAPHAGRRPHIYPQFATHNALTVATIIETAGDKDFEFQRLHGMGEALYAQVHEQDGFACRTMRRSAATRSCWPIWCPAPGERANSSFVNAVNDPDVPGGKPAHPAEGELFGPALFPASQDQAARDIFGERRNSRGIEFGSRLICRAAAGRRRVSDAAGRCGSSGEGHLVRGREESRDLAGRTRRRLSAP
jgi:hypothetical protein